MVGATSDPTDAEALLEESQRYPGEFLELDVDVRSTFSAAPHLCASLVQAASLRNLQRTDPLTYVLE